jgi:hypothetical protein
MKYILVLALMAMIPIAQSSPCGDLGGVDCTTSTSGQYVAPNAAREGCYTPEEAQAQADAWVAFESACVGPKDADCTSAYRAAEDVERACWSDCYNNNPDGPSIAACRDGCDKALAAALDEYNTCIERSEQECKDAATLAYPALEPVCADTNRTNAP